MEGKLGEYDPAISLPESDCRLLSDERQPTLRPIPENASTLPLLAERCQPEWEMQVNVLNVASFDVEEHHRIEAATGITCSPQLKNEYGGRMERSTRMLLEQLHAHGASATFFVVGEIAHSHPKLVRDIVDAGHEVGAHSWDHRPIHHFKPDAFRTDVLKTKDALEQVTGERIHGFRAPTFSMVSRTGWAIDILAEAGFEYDSSIFPVRHDRYGIPTAPRQPFRALGPTREILELPLLTYRLARLNLPVAGGGYFRLFPLSVMRWGLRQAARSNDLPAVAMLYFHPWEFDPEQPRLPLSLLARWRTYVGMRRTNARLDSLLRDYRFIKAIDAVRAIGSRLNELPVFKVEE